MAVSSLSAAATAGRSTSHSDSPESAEPWLAPRYAPTVPSVTGSAIFSSWRSCSSTPWSARTRAASIPADAAADSSRISTVTAPRSTAARTARAISLSQKASDSPLRILRSRPR